MKNKITDKLFELAYTDSMTELQIILSFWSLIWSLHKMRDSPLLFHCCNLPISFEQKIIIINCQSTLD